MDCEPIVFIVDDDSAVRSSLRMSAQSVGLNALAYSSADEFLDVFALETPGCLVLDVRLNGMSGLDLQDELRRRGASIPIIMISGVGDVPTAVRAMKAGALDFFEKPFSLQALLDRIRQAFELDTLARRNRAKQNALRRRLDRLSLRQSQVLELIVDGRTTNQIALDLGLSPKTIYAHRSEALARIDASSIAEAAQQVFAARAS